MAGRSEEVRGWSETLQQRLMGVITTLSDRLIETDDGVEISHIQKKTDGVGKLARAARSVRVMNGPIRIPASKAPEEPPPAVSAPAPKDEAPMDDPTDDTRERTAQLHAEFDRRLDTLFRGRECKGMDEEAQSGDAGGLPPRPSTDGTPSAPSE